MCPTDLRVLTNHGMQGFGMEPCMTRVRKLFYDAYRRDAEMERVDVVICSHPAANCELYMPLNKTLVVYATTRLEFGRHDDMVQWRQPHLDNKSPARCPETL
eukprot:7655581-Pyramimonas_sp.AAC.1